MNKTEYKTPEELKTLTDKTRADTNSFVKKLKKKKPKTLDNIVHELHDEAFEMFDCLDCANCCRTIGPRLTDKDINRLAKHLKMKTSDFINQYILTDEDGDFVFKEHPCPFLLPDNYCLVYENRPKACREYPHQSQTIFPNSRSFAQKLRNLPVVSDVFDELKKMNWK